MRKIIRNSKTLNSNQMAGCGESVFLQRGLANAARARRTGRYASVGAVLRKLDRRLVRAKRQAASGLG